MEPMGPLIIAMKGHPGSGKSTLAHALATSLRCPLIDKDDVRDCTATLQQSLSTSTTTTTTTTTTGGGAPAAKLLNDLSYEVLWRVAATQLTLGLTVVIDSPLSRRAHLDRLLQLAAPAGVHVVVVECRSHDELEWRRRLEMRGAADDASWHKPATWQDLQRLVEGYGGSSDYDVGDVPKIIVDTTSPVGVGEHVSTVLRFIVSHAHHGDLDLITNKVATLECLKGI